MRNRARSGFTLIELLVVIAIIGLLSTLAVVALNSARQRSRDAKRVADIRQIQTAMELAFSETNTYPAVASASTLGTGNFLVLCKNTLSTDPAKFEDITTDCTGTVYMGLVPANPSPNGAAYTYTSLTSAGAACTSTPCASYRLTFNLEGATGQLGSGNNCANPSGIVAGSSC